jgi:hypothetical protein
MLFAFIGFVILNLLSDVLIYFFEHYEFFKFEKIPDENLAPYWNSITGVAQKRWYANEVWMRS